MSTPLLTICVITYNHADYIEEAIESILSQKVSFEWQLIVADDCSTDGTREILQKYQKLHPNKIKLILQSKNVGPESNWLDLIERAKTKYVLYAEGDDYFSDNTKLQTQVDFLDSHPDYAMCFHPVTVVYQDGSRPNEIFPTAEQRFNKTVLTLEDLLKNNFIQTNSVMYRWNFTKSSFKEKYPRGISPGDWFLHILNARKGKIKYLNETMAVYRRHSDGLWWGTASNNLDIIWNKYGISHLRLYEELLKLFGNNEKYRTIIEHHIFEMISNICLVKNVDRKIIDELVAKYPNYVTDYLVETSIKYSEAREHNNGFKNELQQRDSELHHLKNELQQRDSELHHLKNELHNIKSSKFWKLVTIYRKLFGCIKGIR